MIGWRWRCATVQTNRRCYSLTGKRFNQIASTFFCFCLSTVVWHHVESAAHLTRPRTSMPMRGSSDSGCEWEQSRCSRGRSVLQCSGGGDVLSQRPPSPEQHSKSQTSLSSLHGGTRMLTCPNRAALIKRDKPISSNKLSRTTFSSSSTFLPSNS